MVEPPFTEFYEVLPKTFQISLIWGMRLVAIVARVGASVDTTGHFSPLPLAKGVDDGQDQSLGALAAAVGTLVAVGLLVLIMMVVVEARPAEAIFPGKNGKIAFVREGALDSHILTINPDGSGLAKISTRPLFDSSPAWSPDGKKIAFSGLTYSGLTFPSLMRGNADIYVINADGSKLKRITKSPAGDSWPSWPPDGKKIVFVRQRGEGGPSTVCRSCIYKIRVDGTGLKRLTGTKSFATDPAWAPDGKKIAFSKFVRRMRIGGQIFTMNATDGSQKRNLTNARFQESQPDWSPDGKRIAYTRCVLSGSCP